jgi:hypothetical protein
MPEHEPQANFTASTPPLFTSDDLALIKSIRPKISSNGGRFFDLILKLFDSSDPSAPNLSILLQGLEGDAGNSTVGLLYALSMLTHGLEPPNKATTVK